MAAAARALGLTERATPPLVAPAADAAAAAGWAPLPPGGDDVCGEVWISLRPLPDGAACAGAEWWLCVRVTAAAAATPAADGDDAEPLAGAWQYEHAGAAAAAGGGRCAREHWLLRLEAKEGALRPRSLKAATRLRAPAAAVDAVAELRLVSGHALACARVAELERQLQTAGLPSQRLGDAGPLLLTKALPADASAVGLPADAVDAAARPAAAPTSACASTAAGRRRCRCSARPTAPRPPSPPTARAARKGACATTARAPTTHTTR